MDKFAVSSELHRCVQSLVYTDSDTLYSSTPRFSPHAHQYLYIGIAQSRGAEKYKERREQKCAPSLQINGATMLY